MGVQVGKMAEFVFKTQGVINLNTVDSRYSEVGYSESSDIVNAEKCRIWFSSHRVNVKYLPL